jgi:imidazolonepropionase-like amidohydrolase
MRMLLVLLASFVAAGTATSLKPVLTAQTSRPTLALADATLIDGTGRALRSPVTVEITGGRITRITDGEPSGAEQVLDARGKFVIPGLWDMHTHLAYVGDVTATTLVAHGITSVRDPGGELEVIDWLRDRIRDGTLIGPRIFRAGPVVDGSKPGSRDRLVVDTEEDGRRAVEFLKARGVDFIKVHNAAPPAPYFALLREAKRQGLAVVGHIPLGVDPAEAIDAGHTSVEHIVSLFEGPVSRAVKGGRSQDAALADFTDEEARRLARRMVANGTWFDPTLITYWARTHQWELRKTPPAADRYVTASARSFWKNFPALPDQPEVRNALSAAFDRFVTITGILHREGVKILTGSDLAAPLTYPGTSIHDELGLLVKAGLTPHEAIVAATRHGAEATGRLTDLGTVEVGKFADLVVLDADPLADISHVQRIHAVVSNGRLFRRQDLDQMLASVVREAPRR